MDCREMEKHLSRIATSLEGIGMQVAREAESQQSKTLLCISSNLFMMSELVERLSEDAIRIKKGA